QLSSSRWPAQWSPGGACSCTRGRLVDHLENKVTGFNDCELNCWAETDTVGKVLTFDPDDDYAARRVAHRSREPEHPRQVHAVRAHRPGRRTGILTCTKVNELHRARR